MKNIVLSVKSIRVKPKKLKNEVMTKMKAAKISSVDLPREIPLQRYFSVKKQY